MIRLTVQLVGAGYKSKGPSLGIYKLFRNCKRLFNRMILYVFNAVISDYIRDHATLRVPVIRVWCTAVRASVQCYLIVSRSTAQLHLASWLYKD
jgi:hypothetical protein